MINISSETFALIMLGLIIIGIMLGYPLCFVIGAFTLFFGIAEFGSQVGKLVYLNTWEMLINYTYLAVPLFIFMGLMLERSGITERLFSALYLVMGHFRGGLAVMTVLIGTILATCVGIITASVSMLTLICVPEMIKRGYSKSLATGSAIAGGCLGILIPPSIMLVIYGPMAGLSVGKLFFGAFLPGFLLSALYCLYIGIRCYLEPEIAPSFGGGEVKVPFWVKVKMLITSMLPALALVFAVLGVIFFGVAPPTEAAAMGALFATLMVIVYRKMSRKVAKEVALDTFKIAGFILFLVAMTSAFVNVFIGSGGGKFIARIILNAPGGHWGVFTVVMLIVFILGMFMDWFPIVFILVPILNPVVATLAFDEIWFAIMICIIMQTGFMTPPFAPGIFVCRGVCPQECGVTMGDIILGILPYVALVLVGLGVCIAFPQIILWLPNMMIK